MRRTLFFELVALLLAYLLAAPFGALQAQTGSVQTTSFTPNYPPIATTVPPDTSITSPATIAVSGSVGIPGISNLTIPTIPSGTVIAGPSNPNIPNLSAYALGGCTPDRNPLEIIQCSSIAGISVPASFQQASVIAYLVAHGLSATDAPYVFQYGRQDLRDEIRTYMFATLVSIIQKDPSTRTADETLLYDWLTAVVWDRQIAQSKAMYTSYEQLENSSADNCSWKWDTNISSQINLDTSTFLICPPHNVLESITPILETPPLAYFQAYGHAVAYDYQLGPAGNVSVNRAVRNSASPTFLATQSTEISIGEEAGIDAATSVVAPIVAKAVHLNLAEISPLRFSPTAAEALTQKWTNNIRGIKVKADQMRFVRSGYTDSSANSAVDSQRAAITDATDLLPEETEAIADAVESATGVVAGLSVAGTVLGIALVAITTAVAVGTNAVEETQNENDDKTIPTLYQNVQTRTPNLAEMITSAQGFEDIAAAFVLATYPDYPSAVPLPTPTNTQNFYFLRPGSSSAKNSITYLGADGTYWTAWLWNGWLLQHHQVNGVDVDSFGLNIEYTDPSNISYRASRVAPNLFEVEKMNPAPSDDFCVIDSQLGITNPQTYRLDQCASAVTESLNLYFGLHNTPDNTGAPLVTYISQRPVITSQNTISGTDGSPFYFKPTFTTKDPLLQIPCSIQYSGNPPGTSVNSNQALVGTFYSMGAGSSQFTSTVTCGGESTSQVDYVNFGSSIIFSSPNLMFGQVGLPLKFLVRTSSQPFARLTAANLPLGLSFTDNGNGTGTIAGTPSAVNGGLCTTACPTITAQTSVASASQTLVFSIANNHPLTFDVPQAGQTLRFTKGESDPGNNVTLKTNYTAGVKLSVIGLQNLSATFTDNGDGSGTLSYSTPPFDLSSSSGTLTLVASRCCGLPDVTEAVNWVASEPVPTATSVDNGPLAFLVGEQYSLGGQYVGPTISFNVSSQAVTFDSPLPPGLVANSYNNGSNLLVQITGTPTAPGLYHIPISITSATGLDVGHSILDFAVYAPATFPVYDGANTLVFRYGTARSATIGPESGFPIGPFSSTHFGIGSSSGFNYAVVPTSASLIGGTFRLNSGVGSTPNGTVSIFYNGQQSVPASDFVLPLVASATTGPVYGYEPDNPSAPKTGFVPGELTYTDQALLNVHVHVAPMGDANLDGTVNCEDLALVQAAINSHKGGPGYTTALDMNADGVVNLQDLLLVARNLKGLSCQ